MKKLLLLFILLYNVFELYGEVVQIGSLFYSIDRSEKTAWVYPSDTYKKLRSLSIPETVEYNGISYSVIAISGFSHCENITGTLTIPNSVQTIGSYAFSGCTGITRLELGENVEYIGIGAFSECTGLRGSLNLPNSLQTIESQAFYHCGFTGTLNIGDNVQSIGTYAFAGCSGFSGSLIIPNSVDFIGPGAFANCSGFDGTLTLSNSLTIIQSGTFARCSGFTGSLIIPNSVQTIVSWAFQECSGFNGTITIGENVQSIGAGAFKSCSGFTGELIIPEAVKRIDNEVFYGCDNLSALIIKSQDLTIWEGAFYCKNLQFLVSESIIPPECIYVESHGSYYYNIFNYDNYYKTLFVPAKSITAYQNALEWRKFKYINPIPIEASDISLNNSHIILLVGQEETLKATLTPEEATSEIVWFVDDNNSIISIDQNGKVTAKTSGNAIVVATAGEVSARCNVTVLGPEEVSVKPGNGTSEGNDAYTPGNNTENGASLIGNDLTLRVNQTATIDLEIPEGLSVEPKFEWSLDNRGAEFVSMTIAGNTLSAIFKGIKVGETGYTVSIIGANGNIETVKGKITVIAEVPMLSLELEPPEISLAQNALPVKLETKYTPDNATMAEFSWASSNPGVATVDNDGIVIPQAKGQTIITATALDGSGLFATCQVTVNAPIDENFDFDFDESVMGGKEGIALFIGDTYQFTPKAQDGYVLPDVISWSSSDNQKVSVSDSGLVTALALGSATITASAIVNGKEVIAECLVTVIAVPAQTVQISTENLTLLVGQSDKLTATVYPENTTNQEVTWKSDNESVAIVRNDGTVTAISVGSANITAICGRISATCKVTVNPVPASSVELNVLNMSLLVGQSDKLTARVYPENTTNQEVTWKSDNEAVAIVGADGTVTAISVGTANITATCGEVSASCKVTVNLVEVTSIELSPKEVTLLIGSTTTLTAKVYPENATNQQITWSSSNSTVASVDNAGKINALQVGEATITATCSTASATCNVTVSPVAPSSIDLNMKDMILFIGQSETIQAVVRPTNSTYPALTWRSDDESVATVSSDGKVTGVKEGTANITATCANVSASCSVTVNPIPASNIEIVSGNVTLTIGSSTDLVAKVSPENTTHPEIEWRSSDNDIATIDANGTVSAVSTGTAIITAKCGNVSTTCTITVIPVPSEGIVLSPSTVTMLLGDNLLLSATLFPEDTTDKSVNWGSDNPSVASVSSTGLVTALGLGTANITASNGMSKATCVVTVKPVEATSISLNILEETIFVASSTQLVPTISPSNVTDKTITWTSSKPEIATVSDQGEVLGVAVGTTTVTATIGLVSASCQINVVHRIPDMDPEVTTSNRDIVTISGRTVNMAVFTHGGEPSGWSYLWIKNGETVSKSSELNITAINDTETVRAETYRVKVENEIDKVVILSEIFDFVVQIYPAVNETPDATGGLDISISTGTDSPDKTREGNIITLSAKTPDGGYPQGWKFIWSDAQGEIGEGESVETVATMSAGNSMAIEPTSYNLAMINYGPEGDVWSQFNLTSNPISVYRRPLTPTQMLRKGDGTSHTFVTMMTLSDQELKKLGYEFIYGWTDVNGNDHVIEQTNERYCHTEAQVYDDPTNRFWVYSVWVYNDGCMVSSGLRYLDGSVDETFDASVLDGSFVSLAKKAQIRTAIYTVDGHYMGTDITSLVPGIYIHTTTNHGMVKTEKIIIR